MSPQDHEVWEELERRRSRFRRRLRIVLAAFLVLLLVDWALPRRYEITTSTAAGMIRLYRAHVSPHLTGKVSCRFQPTCSAYGLEAVTEDGALVGGLRTAWRIARCGPWTPMNTIDPP